DGQKGMGLIMLILIGTVPTAYALNKAVDASKVPAFVEASRQASDVLGRYYPAGPASSDPQKDVTEYVRTHSLEPQSLPALQQLIGKVSDEVASYHSLAAVPPDQVGNVRNQMYLIGEALHAFEKHGAPEMNATDKAALKTYGNGIGDATKFIPSWVKVAVAIALGLGTMIGWKRIVVTVGEKIGKQHLTYAQGASAELVAMATIGAADMYGLPVSTTHVLSSGVAGTMAANRSGLQWSTVKNLALAWILTLPASIALSGLLFWFLRSMVG
ncbi:MAG: inorganic phosphate transporter, partial [Alphaproteobacteria bacterium]|nr:inorganic phosphate transporter [Alphaproteobacteria bacterium]